MLDSTAKHVPGILAAILVLAIVMISCEGEEESGTRHSLDETCDEIRGGARLILSYDEAGNGFIGTVENVTESTLERVRVEVHLSNGTELGPTTPRDLAHAEFGGSGESGEGCHHPEVTS